MRVLPIPAPASTTESGSEPGSFSPEGLKEGGSRDEQVTAYAIDYLYRGLPVIMGNLTLMPLIIGGLMWGRVDTVTLVAWMVVALLTILARLLLARAYAKRPPPASEARRWAGYFTWTSLVSGFTWGLASIVFFVADSVAHQVILYVSIAGLASGSLIVTAYWLPSFFAFALPAVGMTAAYLAFQDDWAHKGLGAIMLMFIVIITRVARQQNRTALEAITLRFQNLDLVAELRRQTEVAEQANAAKSRFLAAASHDLRQPLHALQLFVGSLAGDLKADRQGEVVAGINRSVASLDTLFNALLDISRLDAGLLKPQIKSFRLAELIEGFIDEFRHQALAKGLNFNVDAGAWVVKSDPALLETILRNLLGNALRYTPSGHIELGVKGKESQVFIHVRDTGIGIPPERQKEIFSEYVQLANPERDRSKGLGLGLAIVDRLVRLLGHGIQVQSRPGKGACFTLALPAGEDPEPLASAPFLAGSADEFAGRAVLVIDDEHLVREGMRALMEGWGCQVLEAEDIQDALLLIEARGAAPDLVIADYRLRDNQTGAEAVAMVRARHGAGLPALLMTGDTAPERLREAQASGLPLLHKPVPLGRLRNVLRQAWGPASPK
ncbi:MAG: hybrid sensor histidine kinase/response regulator [Pseudomonadota bacterium]